MKKLLSIAYLTVCLLIVTPALIASGQVKMINGGTLSSVEIDRFIEDKMQALNMPGLSIAVINDGKTVYHRAFGVSNIRTEKLVDTNTLFEAASMSKPVFAYLVMKLAEEGKIDLDKPLYHYKANEDLAHDDRYKLITARMVLTHTSGLPNWRSEEKFHELKIRFTPGASFHYSGEGYGYLGKVIAHITGENLDKLMKRYVLEPFGMDRSSFVWNDFLEAHKATGYAFGNTERMMYRPLVPHMAGSLHSEATDFAKFLIGVMNGEGLTDASYEDMFSRHVALPAGHEFRRDLDQEAWGLGWAIDSTRFGTRYTHGGDNGDFQSYFEIFKDQKIGYVFFTNSDQGRNLNVSLRDFLNTGETNYSLLQTYDVYNRTISHFEHRGLQGIELNANESDGFAWLRDTEFSEGVIELDLMGANRRGESFIGIAFHAVDNTTYDAIYFRPFNFVAEDPAFRSRMVQYVNHPTHGWRELRDSSPGVYEGEIINAPNPDDWFHARIEVKGKMVTVYVNQEKEPVLQVEKLSERTTGKIGLWAGYRSSARFASVRVEKH